MRWRSTFFINAPLALIAFAMAVTWVPADPVIERRGGLAALASQLDVLGMLFFGGTIHEVAQVVAAAAPGVQHPAVEQRAHRVGRVVQLRERLPERRRALCSGERNASRPFYEFRNCQRWTVAWRPC